MSNDTDALLDRARLAEQSERYEDMAQVGLYQCLTCIKG